MSTKTTFKRIALVAVAALGLGTMSVVPVTEATSANATYTAPTTLNLLGSDVGTGALSSYVGAVQIDLSSLDTAMSITADSASVTITAFDAAVAKDVKFANALSLSLTDQATTAATIALSDATGYNPLSNGVVTIGAKQATLLPLAVAGIASGRAWLNLTNASLATTDTGAKVKYTLTVAGAGVVRTLVSSLTLAIGTKAGTATTALTTGVVAAGGTVTASHVQPYTNVAANATIAPANFDITDTIANGDPTFSVTAVVTGGSGTTTRISATRITPGLLKNQLTGDLSVSYTISVTVPSTAVAGETVTVYGWTWTVQPYTPTYNNSTLTVTLGNNGYRVSAALGGDGIAWASAASKTDSVMTVAIQQKDQNSANITAPAYAKTVSATITGKGSLAAITGADVVVKTESQNAVNGYLTGNDSFTVYSDGTAGEGKLEVSVDGTVVGTYTLRFYGDAASVKATLVYAIGNSAGAVVGTVGAATTADTTVAARANTLAVASSTKDVGSLTDPAIAVSVLDANGWAIPTIAPVATSSNLTVVSAASRLFIDSGVSNPALLKYSAGTFVQHFSYTTLASKSGSTSDLTFTFVNVAGTALVSPAVKVTVGGALASATLAFDKASYAPGAVAILTATGLDSSGNKAYDGQDVMDNDFLSTLSFTPPTSIVLLNGTKAKTLNAPLASGTWTVTAYDALDRTYTATATVTNPAQDAADSSAAALDAASEATDAANAATDAANAAAEAADAATAAAQDAADAVAALSTQVSEMVNALKKQITALTNQVIKIQKKVQA